MRRFRTELSHLNGNLGSSRERRLARGKQWWTAFPPEGSDKLDPTAWRAVGYKIWSNNAGAECLNSWPVCLVFIMWTSIPFFLSLLYVSHTVYMHVYVGNYVAPPGMEHVTWGTLADIFTSTVLAEQSASSTSVRKKRGMMRYLTPHNSTRSSQERLFSSTATSPQRMTEDLQRWDRLLEIDCTSQDLIGSRLILKE